MDKVAQQYAVGVTFCSFSPMSGYNANNLISPPKTTAEIASIKWTREMNVKELKSHTAIPFLTKTASSLLFLVVAVPIYCIVTFNMLFPIRNMSDYISSKMIGTPLGNSPFILLTCFQ
jgi:hypothetical protein